MSSRDRAMEEDADETNEGFEARRQYLGVVHQLTETLATGGW